MPNIMHLLQMARTWRIDSEEPSSRIGSSTPIVTVLPSVEVAEKVTIVPDEKPEKAETSCQENDRSRDNPLSWLMLSLRNILPSSGDKGAHLSELQTMLPSAVTVHRLSNAGRPPEDNGGICLMTESPFRILRIAEGGNLETFERLYYADPSKLSIKDSRGRTAAHQAAAKNRINILQFILTQGGDLNNQDNAGNTPLHLAVEHESLEAVDYLLQACQLPDELPNASYPLPPDVLNTSYPWDSFKKKYSQCSMLVNNSEKPCEGFIYDTSVYGYSAVIEWELTCGRAHTIATSNSIFMIGVMLGSIIFGQLSDKYGRKLIFFISLVIQVVFGFISAFAPELWSFSFARAIVGATTSGVFLVAYVIALEMVGPKKRLLAGTVCQMFFSTGYMLTALFAVYINDWRDLQLALTAPGVVFFCYWWLIPESTRWLLNQDRLAEAKSLIQIAARANKKTITDAQLDILLVSESKPGSVEPQKQATILDIFKHSNIRKRSLIILFDWFANNITYYGLSWNTNNLGGNPYINFVISGAVEIPAYIFLLLTLNRWGRKFVMCGCMIVAGLALLLTMAIPNEQQWLVITLAMIGKLSITASYGAVYIFSTEQFPTVVRNAGLGAASTCARIGSVTSPYINLMSKFWDPLPLIIFGSLSLVGGIMSLVLPETLNKKLPETIEEGEAFGKKLVQRVDEEMPLRTNGTERTNVPTNGELRSKRI